MPLNFTCVIMGYAISIQTNPVYFNLMTRKKHINKNTNVLILSLITNKHSFVFLLILCQGRFSEKINRA